MPSQEFPVTRRAALGTTAAVVLSSLSAPAAEATPNRVLVVVGPSAHPPGTHEVAAGGRLLQHCITSLNKPSGLKSDVVTEWPSDAKSLSDVASVVFIGDMFPPEMMPNRDRIMANLADLMKRGCGLVCLHYANGLEAKHVSATGEHPLLGWMGGYYATRCTHHKSVARLFKEATVEPCKIEHPVVRGWKKFTLHDEPYINNYFGKDGPAKNVTILATAELPPEKPKAEAVAWAVQREDGGRGVGVVMPHFYKNWGIDELRTLILNAIIWTAKQEVPAGGIQVKLPELTKFKPDSVEPIPKKK
jgi:type 1 glutamine amidotransferase